MADNGIVKHSDLFDANLTQPTIKEMLALMDVFDKTETKIKSFATTYKSAFTGKMTTSYEDVTKLAEESEKVNKVYVENATLLKEKIRLQDKLNLALTEEAQDVAALRVELEKVNLQNKQNAKITSESIGAYGQATAKLAQMTRAYKDLVIAGKESNSTAISFKKSLDELRASVIKADASVVDHKRNIGAYEQATAKLAQMTRAYKDLVIAGEESSSTAISLKKSLDELRASVIKTDASVVDHKRNIGAYEQATAKLAQMTRTYKDLVIAGKESSSTAISLKKSLDELRASVIKADASISDHKRNIGAYEQATAKLAQMTRAYKDLVIAGKESSSTAISLKKSLDELRASVIKADASVGDHRRNVGNYASGFNGLQNSINQVTREMPAFVNSAQTGFMAISNNLPTLVDQIKQLKDNNRQLIADGKPAQSVFKSLAGALFSWGSALSVGITLVTLYGKEIGDFFKKLVGLNVQTKEQIELEKKVKETRESNIQAMAKERVEIEGLARVIQSENATNKAKHNAYLELQKLVPELTKLTYEQAQGEGVLTAAIEKQLKVIKLRGEIQALEEILSSDLKNKYIREEQQRQIEDAKSYNLFLQERLKLQAIINSPSSTDNEIEAAKKSLEFYEAKLNTKSKSIQQIYDEKNAELLNLEVIQDANVKAGKTAEQLEKDAYEFKKRLTELGTNNIKNEYQKRLQLALIDYEENKRIAERDIKDEIVKNETLKQLLIKYNSEVSKIEADRLEDKRKRDAEIEKEFNDFWEKENKAQLEAYDNELKLAKKQKEEKDKLAKENAKSESESIKQTLSIIEAGGQRRQSILENINERELNLTKERQGELRQLAALGIQDANNNLAFEEKREAELLAKKQKLEERKRRQELATAAIKSYSANVEKAGGDGTALTKTLKDISVLMGAVRAIPAFFEGTEDTGIGGKIDNKGGFIATLHPHERVVPENENKLIGDLSNSELAQIANMYNNGLLSPTYFDKVPMSNHVNDNVLVNELKSVKGEIKELQKIIENKPVQKIDYDPIKNAVLNIEYKGGKTTITEMNNKGGLFRG